MSLCNRQIRSRVGVKTVLAIAAVLSLSFLVACSSSSPKGQAPPTGGFSNSNLSGTYAFSVIGEDVNGGIVAFAGTFAANGSGGITSGTIDIVQPSVLSAPAQGVGVTSGGYSVGADGRPESNSGLLTLATASNGTFYFDYVLSSSNGGLITYYSTLAGDGGTGSGSFQLQTSVAQSSINGQAYAFSTSGASSTGAPFATAGAFTLNGSGGVAAGIEDVVLGSTYPTTLPCTATGCTMSGGNITLSGTSAPGTASFVTTPGTFTFDVYPVSPSQLIFIETDQAFITTGTAFTQATSIPAGNNVYSVSGLDYTEQTPSGDTAPEASAGLLVTNGSGEITSGYQDYNDNGSSPTTPSTLTSGSYTPLTSGRSVMTLVGFVNQSGLGCSSCSFALYPFASGGVTGMEILEIDGGGITGGVAYAQGASPTFASGQGYGLNLSGTNEANSDAEEDDIAEFAFESSGSCSGGASGTNLCGLIDFNDTISGTTQTSFGQSYSSAYAADTSISGHGAVAAGNNAYGMATYVVNDSTSLAVVNDGSGMVAVGTIDTQSATTAASANAVQQHLVAIRAASMAGKHLKKGKSR